MNRYNSKSKLKRTLDTVLLNENITSESSNKWHALSMDLRVLSTQYIPTRLSTNGIIPRTKRCSAYLLAMDDLNAKFHVRLLGYADDMVVDVLAEARYGGCVCAAGGRQMSLLEAAAATRCVNAHAHEHFRVVDDDLFPLVPRVCVTEILDAR